jgi:hypothetical protein
MDYVKEVCHQVNETFVDQYTPVPTSCRTADCARAVKTYHQEYYKFCLIL